MMNRTRPNTAGTLAMKKVAAMHCTVKSRRKGIRRPPRSDSAPRIGDTIALMPDADGDRHGQQHTAVPTTELVGEIQPDGARHDGEAEDRVREVVQGP